MVGRPSCSVELMIDQVLGGLNVTGRVALIRGHGGYIHGFEFLEIGVVHDLELAQFVQANL